MASLAAYHRPPLVALAFTHSPTHTTNQRSAGLRCLHYQ